MRKNHNQLRRRGVAIVIVMALVAIALATGYSLLRSQATVVRVQSNVNERNGARQAAVAGLSIAMQKISGAGWGGVNTTIVGNLSDRDSYSVTYSPGDPTLPATDPNQPYRVTIVSTGYSSSPSQTSQQASYRIRAVMRLVGKQLGPEPTNWSSMTQFTVYQNGSGKLILNSPCQIQGTVRVQGQVQLGTDYNWSSSAQQRYLGDLNAMRQGQLGDNRPLTGAITLPLSSTDTSTQSLLSAQLGLTLNNASAASSVSLPLPALLTGYQIYQGGPVYKVGQLASTLSSVNLIPDPVNNPLGIFFSSSDVTLGNTVSINGTLISGGNVNISGTGVSLAPYSLLPTLTGNSTPIRLPAIVAKGNFRANSGLSAVVSGTVITGGSVTFDQGSQGNYFSLYGHLIAGSDIQIRGRTEWQLAGGLWGALYTAFTAQLGLPNKVLYFPTYIATSGLNSTPLLTFKPDTSLLLHHWQDLSGPIYVPATGDGGLRWELMSWTENI